MPFSSKEKRREYARKLYQKEKIKESKREYYEKNKEKKSEYYKVYYQSPAGIKSMRKKNWKRGGVKWNDFDELYKRYINSERCETCGKEYTITKGGYFDRCLEHNHETGEVRSICCNSCNSKMREKDKIKNN